MSNFVNRRAFGSDNVASCRFNLVIVTESHSEGVTKLTLMHLIDVKLLPSFIESKVSYSFGACRFGNAFRPSDFLTTFMPAWATKVREQYCPMLPIPAMVFFLTRQLECIAWCIGTGAVYTPVRNSIPSMHVAVQLRKPFRSSATVAEEIVV